jgi:hypothetical protein
VQARSRRTVSVTRNIFLIGQNCVRARGSASHALKAMSVKKTPCLAALLAITASINFSKNSSRLEVHPIYNVLSLHQYASIFVWVASVHPADTAEPVPHMLSQCLNFAASGMCTRPSSRAVHEFCRIRILMPKCIQSSMLRICSMIYPVVVTNPQFSLPT